jgi:uncharacterized YccA/Bax inhibitor family protein
MESRNPIFSRTDAFQRGGYAGFRNPPTPSAGDLNQMYAAPSATSLDTGRMTLDDVVVKTGLLFAVLLAVAVPTYFVWHPGPLVVLGSMLAALAISLVASFSKAIRPPLYLVYAVVEGVFVGGVSSFYANAYQGIVPQAVLGTLCAFATMLVLYRAGIVRNSPRFTRVLMIAGVGYLVFGLLNLFLSLFTGWHNVYSGGGLLPVLISGFGVVLASLFLVLDFDTVEQGIRNNAPKAYAWVAGFGFLVTLVWLYLEVLRLLAVLRNLSD